MMLSVNDLSVSLDVTSQVVYAVDRLSFDLQPGEVLGIVGESGSGKTQAMLALLGLNGPQARCTGSVNYAGQTVLGTSTRQLNQLRGNEIAMVFQDPMSALNPYLKVSTQLIEAVRFHKHVSVKEAREKAVHMLERVNIPDAKRRIDHYPHQFSGGMRQRIMIAMALIREPRILIADEPTTSLDVTVQSEILSLLISLKREMDLAIILITHDLSIVASVCDRVLVMYAGRVVEQAGVEALFDNPRHPYTQGLLKSARSVTDLEQALFSIQGNPPRNTSLDNRCAFYPRCEQHLAICDQQQPALLPVENGADTGHRLACHLYNE